VGNGKDRGILNEDDGGRVGRSGSACHEWNREEAQQENDGSVRAIVEVQRQGRDSHCAPPAAAESLLAACAVGFVPVNSME
jgi:hypothetical protein